MASRNLGAEIGFTSVLHTWAQNLAHHPHVHCIVTAGGLSADSQRWIHARSRYLLPVKVLGKRFKHLFIQALLEARKQGQLHLTGRLSDLQDPLAWASFRNALYQKSWVVYTKRAFHDPSHVFRYLGNYTHRIGISNYRLVALDSATVTFTVRDRNALTGKRRLTLDAQEFLRRFLLHVLPKGFVRIRRYVFYASSYLATKRTQARRLLEPHPPPVRTEAGSPSPSGSLLASDTPPPCPRCGHPLIRWIFQKPGFPSSRAPPGAA